MIYIKKDNIKKTLQEVSNSLEKGGYNPQIQIVGYLTSNDPGYVSTYENAREKMISLDREEVIRLLLDEFMRK